MSSPVTDNINTIIFCVLAKAVIVGLLVLLLFDIGMEFQYLILTATMGLFIVIGLTLYRIYQNKKAIDDASIAALKAKPSLDVCPDYFVKSVTQENNVVCDAKYNGNQYTFTDGTSTSAFPSIPLSEMVQSSNTMSELCTTNVNKYANISWTELKSKCGVFDTIQ
jgi:hypothetical protein